MSRHSLKTPIPEALQFTDLAIVFQPHHTVHALCTISEGSIKNVGKQQLQVSFRGVRFIENAINEQYLQENNA